MKILCVSIWKNSWIPYWTTFLKKNGHEVKWLIGADLDEKKARPPYDWADCVLSMWACGYAVIFSKWNEKPLFVVHRSFEVFEDTNLPVNISDIEWNNVTQLFMLNESHYPIFEEKITSLNPIFIKNGIDLDYFPLTKKTDNSFSRIAWICNINHKKGAINLVHAISHLRKADETITVNHIGLIQSRRIKLYLQNILPHLNCVWKNYGYNNNHAFVKNFLKTCQSIISTSIVEGHPMNILEAMAMGCKPLIHRYPGVEYQFPEDFIWANYDELVYLYEQPYRPNVYRQYIADHYNYNKTYRPVLECMEKCMKS